MSQMGVYGTASLRQAFINTLFFKESGSSRVDTVLNQNLAMRFVLELSAKDHVKSRWSITLSAAAQTYRFG
jgi:hypothetical protein